ncbi:MAG: hypothetical protein ACK6CO_13225 [Cyanobacteriota bacterium]
MIPLPLLLLKLLLVPSFVLLITLASQRWGPALGGWLAALPLVTGPVLLFLAIEQGPPFAAKAAVATLSAVLAFVAFSCTYAHTAQRQPWLPCLLLAWLAWGGAAVALSALPAFPPLAFGLALIALTATPRFFPPATAGMASRLAPLPPRVLSRSELASRMLAGAALTVAVTGLATMVGSAWSGLLAGFPVLGSVLATFAHRCEGFSKATLLLGGMLRGVYSIVVFCFFLALALPHLSIPLSFSLALLAATSITAAQLLLTDRRTP